MFCQNCGNELPENTKFCSYCGAGVVNTAAEAPQQTYQQPQTSQQNYYQQPQAQQGYYQQQQAPQQTYQQSGFQAQQTYQQPQAQQGYYQQPQQSRKAAKTRKGGGRILSKLIRAGVVIGGLVLGGNTIGKNYIDQLMQNETVAKVVQILPWDIGFGTGNEEKAEGSSGSDQKNKGLQTSGTGVSENLVFIELGALSVQFPQSYKVEESDYQIDMVNPDYPDVVNSITLYREAEYEPGLEEWQVEQLKETFHSISNEREEEEEGYKLHYFLGSASADGIDYFGSCYVFYTDTEMYVAAFMMQGSADALKKSEQTLAFLP